MGLLGADTVCDHISVHVAPLVHLCARQVLQVHLLVRKCCEGVSKQEVVLLKTKHLSASWQEWHWRSRVTAQYRHLPPHHAPHLSLSSPRTFPNNAQLGGVACNGAVARSLSFPESNKLSRVKRELLSIVDLQVSSKDAVQNILQEAYCHRHGSGK